MKLSLIVLTGRRKGKLVPVPCSPFVIGRDRACHLRPVNPAMSRRQCALTVQESKVFVEDLKSPHGTYVNNRLIKGKIELLDGDRLKIGPLVFGVCLEATPAPAAEDAAAALLLAQPEEERANPRPSSVAPSLTPYPPSAPTPLPPTLKMPRRRSQSSDPPFGTVSAAKALLRQYKRRRKG
jgi:pSer/pThr/pTyr-binding forkhead associated (FHA) protein